MLGHMHVIFRSWWIAALSKDIKIMAHFDSLFCQKKKKKSYSLFTSLLSSVFLSVLWVYENWKVTCVRWCLPSNKIASIKDLKDCFNININSLLFCSVCIVHLQPVLFTYILIFSENSCELNSTLLLNTTQKFSPFVLVYNLI